MLGDQIDLEWTLPSSPQELLLAVSRRARVIRRRRVPSALAATATVVALVVLATHITGEADQSSLRTAGQDDGPTFVDERRSVEAGDVKVTAEAGLWGHPLGGKVGVEVTPGEGQGPHRAAAGVNEAATTALSTHPLITDPVGDADASSFGNGALRRDYSDSADIRTVDARLVGDTVTAEIQLVSMSALTAEDQQDEYFYEFHGRVFGDLEITLQVSVDRFGRTGRPTGKVIWKGGRDANLATARLRPTSHVDLQAATVSAAFDLSDLNEALQSDVFAARRAQGDLTVSKGTRMTDIYAFASAPAQGVFVVNDAASAEPDAYWAIGD